MRAANKQVLLGQAVKPHKRGSHCKSQRRETILVPNECLESQHDEQLFFESKVAKGYKHHQTGDRTGEVRKSAVVAELPRWTQISKTIQHKKKIYASSKKLWVS